MRTPAKGGVLVYDVKYLSNFLHSNRSNRLVIPLIEAVLLSTIPLIDQTRISMIDILDGLADEHPIEILAVFENLIRSDWFDRCSRAKFEQILIRSEKFESEILRVLFAYIVTKYENTVRTKLIKGVFMNPEMVKTLNPTLDKRGLEKSKKKSRFCRICEISAISITMDRKNRKSHLRKRPPKL